MDTDTPLTIAVVAASVREGRISHVLAAWARERVAATGVRVDEIDLRDDDVPADEALAPGGGVASPTADRVAAADGYVFVTPEYNHSYPAPLKRFIDGHYSEWNFKPATVLSYGVLGGLLATEHLRGVLAELHVVTTRRTVGLRTPWSDIEAPVGNGSPGTYEPDDDTAGAVDAAVDELVWWAETLRTARRDRPYVPGARR